jgi:iron complex transport system ATP-binding protein
MSAKGQRRAPQAWERHSSASLEADRLAFGYADRNVGSDASLRVDGGEIVCLLGPNGAGKTTLFRTLLGLLPPRGGAIRICGDPIGQLSRTEIARRIAYVPQAQLGYFPFSVLDVATMGRTAHIGAFSAPTRRDCELAQQALERVGLAKLAAQPYTQVSGGERQLALIARALAQASPLMILDEPTASLDFGNQVRVLAIVRELSRSGAGLLIATHDPGHALQLADRVAILHEGRLMTDTHPADAITASTLRRVYGVDVELRDIELPDGSVRRVCVAVRPIG